MQVFDVRSRPADSGFLVELDGGFFLVDNGFGFTGRAVAQNVLRYTERLDFQFLTHSHYDHAGGTPYIKRAFSCPVAAGSYAAKIFAKDSAKAVMRDLDSKFAKTCGVEPCEDYDALCVDIAVEDGEEVGDSGFAAVALPGHTKCSVGYYRDGFLISSETLGVYRGEGRVVPSYLVGVDMALDSIQKVADLAPKQMLLPHFGLVEDPKWYLHEARESALRMRDMIAKILRTGTREDAINRFVETFYSDAVAEIYPRDAMLLNTGIMVDLIARETGNQ